MEELEGNMVYTAATWEELGISNDFLFGKILKDTSMPFGVI